MNETTPKYILELENKLKEHIDTRFDKVEDRLDRVEEKLDKHDKKLDSHFETIGEMKVQVTEIHLTLPKKASYEYVEGIDKRTKKLEKTVFA